MTKPEKPTHVIELAKDVKALVYIYHKDQTVYRKQRVNGLTVKDSAGKPVFYSMTVPGTSLSITLEGRGEEVKGQLVSRSCCKPPDNFCRKTGTRIALLNAFKKDSKKILTKEHRKTLVAALFPELYKKVTVKPVEMEIRKTIGKKTVKKPLTVKLDNPCIKGSKITAAIIGKKSTVVKV
jgi:hypothetical protein